MKSITERLDSFAEAWRPEPGDKLVGLIVDLDERVSQYSDDPYPVVTVQTDDGEELAFHAFRTVARNELAKLRPAVGDRIGVAYHGKKDGRNWESYKIIVERADPEPRAFDWDKHVTDDAAEPAVEPEPVSEPAKEASEDDIPF